ncbi:copper resistance system multicopper oxidase [Pelagerythrobacter aerophilus]|uniref:Copper resistance system multicopper oxidase n=1 Tax=Pelagerythrobacter aerophilus TaxID=2306995 RepID=A0A418NE00_9SPHN|nr:copper resistance system multicopper oxidase [Pelagerythrobacter aerophilus]RIV75546.1 copper resistance system multicopper oxidase [Pelagerythrobacter aerophilus]
MTSTIDRRSLLRAGAMGAAGLGWSGLFPAWAQTGSPGLRPQMPTLSGEDIRLTVGHSPFTVGGRNGHAITLNGVLPAPLIRLREGQNVRIHVENTLDEDTSIHWHGLILPFHMDGVPGISFPGILPKTTFTYEFPIVQNGTYWYHSHSGLQEQSGHYGPLVIDPADSDPVAYDREHVIVLSDWTFLHPHELFGKLKQQGGYFNRQRQTLAGLIGGEDELAHTMPLEERMMWGKMRMDPADIADVTGATYTFLVNGHGAAENWTGLFRPGERVRLRFINASAMTIFNIRIPGLPMTIVSADGQNVQPVETDEFQISVAETYDAIVTPTEDRAFTLVAESIDRSGMGRATLAPRMGMQAPVPPLRRKPVLGMKDMGMGGMDHGSMPGMDHGSGSMNHGMRDKSLVPDDVDVDVGVGVDMIAPMPVDRTGDRPLGLEDEPHRVLTYHDLAPLRPFHDKRQPTRSVDIHLTGNMERFMWSFDGKKLNEGAEPIRFARNERVRVNLINNSMMSHPIHIHGHFFELVTGMPAGNPVKHTVNVMPGGKASFDLTADAPGDWAFHCHLLYHMHAGMMNVVKVRPMDDEGEKA